MSVMTDERPRSANYSDEGQHDSEIPSSQKIQAHREVLAATSLNLVDLASSEHPAQELDPETELVKRKSQLDQARNDAMQSMNLSREHQSSAANSFDVARRAYYTFLEAHPELDEYK